MIAGFLLHDMGIKRVTTYVNRELVSEKLQKIAFRILMPSNR